MWFGLARSETASLIPDGLSIRVRHSFRPERLTDRLRCRHSFCAVCACSCSTYGSSIEQAYQESPSSSKAFVCWDCMLGLYILALTQADALYPARNPFSPTLLVSTMSV